MKPEVQELLPDIALFVAVAKAKSFSGAARLLRVPVSTLSRRVAEFESRLGVQLLHRTTRQVALTPAGARYFERCTMLVDAVEAAQADLLGEAAEPRGVLRISATQDFAAAHLAPVLHAFARRHPEVAFELDLSARPVDLVGEGFDVAIRMGALPDSQMVVRKLGNFMAGLYASPGYLAQHGEPQHPQDLANHSCLRIRGAAAGSSRWTLHGGDGVEVVAVRGRFVASSMRALLDLAEASFGVALIDEAIARDAERAGRVRRVLTGWHPAAVPVHALTASKLLASRTRLFLDCLRDHLQADLPPDRHTRW